MACFGFKVNFIVYRILNTALECGWNRTHTLTDGLGTAE